MSELVAKEGHEQDRANMIRFLRSVEFDAQKAALLYNYDFVRLRRLFLAAGCRMLT